MPRRRVLFISHNHPAIRPGGAEAYALELQHALQDSPEFDPIFLAKVGPPMSKTLMPHEGTPFMMANGGSNEYFFYTEGSDYNHLFGTSRRKETATQEFAMFLREHRPDIVHFQHTLFLGYDFVRVARNVLPDTPIVYTLHEYLPICHRNGQMVRTLNEELCREESPRRCHECFPEISPETFFLRKRYIQSQLAQVDLFLAPSQFLRDRYIAWGISEEKIVFEDYGRLPIGSSEQKPPVDRARKNLGFFGQVTRFKGVDLLLEAMAILGAEGSDAHLWIHGANLEIQRPGFQEKVHALLDATRDNATLVGRYDHEELPNLMAGVDWVVVPSTWWENSPLVIQEAFAYRRPVICSDIGGMAEKVEDGVTGLHFRARDPRSLADAIRRATETPMLWERLRNAITGPYPMVEHVARVTEMYSELLERRSDSNGN